MSLKFLIKGVLLGFSFAAPIRLIWIFCVKQTQTYGRLAGMLSGLAASSATIFYSILSSAALTFVALALGSGQLFLSYLGGFFLFFFGIKVFLAKPLEQLPESAPVALSKAGGYKKVFLASLKSWMTPIILFLMFAGVGLGLDNNGPVAAPSLILGVFIGSNIWWLVLSFIVYSLEEKFTPDSFILANKIAGVILLGLGVLAFVRQI